MPTIYLIGCGKGKRDVPSMARDLYTGALFQKSLAYAESTGGPSDAAYVLSALHHVVDPWRVVAPYDLALTDLDVRERQVWGTRVVEQLVAQAGSCAALAQFTIVVLAGRPYVDSLRHGLSLHCRHAFRIEEPLDGLQIGERLAKLNELLQSSPVHVP